jgi:predicted enzyme related to lactoylglutathione lyase
MELIGPIFYSDHFKDTVSFYKQLGLTMTNLDDNKFASFEFQDGHRLGIKAAIEPREIAGSQTVMVKISAIDELYKDARNQKWKITYELSNEAWGKTFIIADPDNNRIEFIEPI